MYYHYYLNVFIIYGPSIRFFHMLYSLMQQPFILINQFQINYQSWK